MKKTIAICSIIFGTSAYANTYNYMCFSYYWNGHKHLKGIMTLKVDGETAEADIVSESWDQNLGGKINAKYKSKGITKFLKFGNELILEEALVTGGKLLKDKKLGGIARVEGQAEGGFYQYKFICKR